MADETDETQLSEACYAEGRALFPRIVWNRSDFGRACLERWAGQRPEDLAARLAVGRGRAEEYLILACLARRPGGLETLESEYITELAGRVRRICPQPDVVDDVLQMVREKLLLSTEPSLAAYENRGYLRAWLTIVAARTALDVTRRGQARRTQLEQLDDKLLALSANPEAEYLGQEAQAAFRNALREAVRRLPEKQRFALKMQLVAGWSIDQIGRALSTHRATAARWLLSARERLERDVREQLVERLSLNEAEVRCLMGQMRSQLDVRFSQIFRTTEHSGGFSEKADRGAS
ncbi:MAG TPA: sigma-70 family RNA polymerase sigma factor [Polyangiaceae bacterium]|nr:sigma-70 family RNA polymerase sigma factor [Polyangiaceae bacterium]